jgi:4-amino-4-deoxy-L-arabinose transferase-like glycosyltransferase
VQIRVPSPTRHAAAPGHDVAPPNERWAALRAAALSPLVLGSLATVVACIWFLSLDARHLLPADEGRYAEIAREMLGSGDWVTPRYDGLKYFEKPPLQFWMTALTYQAFGIGEWQARLWSAFSGAVGLVFTAFAASRWYGTRVGILSAAVLLATPGWNIGSHFSSLDMGLSGALAVVLACVLLAQHPSATASRRRNWMLGAWAAAGIAVLTKGPIGIVLPGLVLVVHSAVTRDVAIWRRLHLGAGLLLMLAIAEPWFVLVSQRNPEFARFFFIHEHVQRFLSPIHRREGAWWYFVPQLLVGFLPWLGLGWPMVKAVRAEDANEAFRPALLLALWAATIFVFFSASSSKLPGYILPIYPALAILAAVALDRLAPPTQWRRHVVVAIVLVGAGALATPFLARLGTATTPNVLYRQFALWVAAALLLGLVGLGVAWRLNREPITPSVIAYALTFFLVTTVVLRGHEVFGASSSGAALAAQVKPVLGPDTPLYSVRLLDHTVPFYLRRIPVLVESPGELEFGVGQEPDKWIPTLDAFLTRWSAGSYALALMSHATYDELRARNAPLFVVGEDVRRVVVANRAPLPR